jgi:hypothetical protein
MGNEDREEKYEFLSLSFRNNARFASLESSTWAIDAQAKATKNQSRMALTANCDANGCHSLNG